MNNKINLAEFFKNYFSNFGPGTFDCPFRPSQGHDFTIDEYFNYECKQCGLVGSIIEFIETLEGVPRDNWRDHVKSILDYDWTNIDRWHQELFKNSNVKVKDVLNKEYGLDDSLLQEYQIGFNAQTNEVVLPIFNATKQGYAGVKFIDHSNRGSGKIVNKIGEARIWNFQELRMSQKGTQVIIVKDEFDALLLQKLGYLSVSCLDGVDGWGKADEKYFVDKNVVVCLGSAHAADASLLNLQDILVDHVGSLKVIDIKGDHLSDYFIKDGKQKSDFESLINQANIITRDTLEFQKDLKEDLSTKAAIIEINPAQDYVNGKMYYAIQLKGKNYLLDSDAKRTEEKDLIPDKGFRLTTSEFPESQFSVSGINNFISNRNVIPTHELFDIINKHIRKYIFINIDDVYTVLTLWAMGTYVFRMFTHYPYIHLMADKESGKSMLLDVLSGFTFNAKMYVHPTAYVIFRDVHLNSSTILNDEVEKLKNQDKATHEALMSILNSGYAKSGSVPRKENKKIVQYNTYSPKLFAGMSNLADTLSDRSIHIQLIKISEKDKKDHYDGARLVQMLNELKNHLYVFGLSQSHAIADKYDKIDSLSYVEDLIGRTRDRWAPILILAELVDNSRADGENIVVDSAKKYLIEDKELHGIADAVDSEIIKTLTMVRTLLNEPPLKKMGDVYRYKNDKALAFFIQRPGYKKLSLNKLTALLRTIEIRSETEDVGGGKQRCYNIDKKRIYELGVLYHAWEEIKPGSDVPDDEHDQRFVPKRIIVTPNAKEFPFTQQIIDRIAALNKDVKISESENGNPVMPFTVQTSKEKYNYLRETVVLSERSGPMIETFKTPGDIVEETESMCRLCSQCPCDCEFCYLQSSVGTQQTRWRRYFVDIDRVEKEIEIEQLVRKMGLTIWSALSFYWSKPLPKIYDSNDDQLKSLFNVCDDIRNRLLSQGNNIRDDNDAKKYLKDSLAQIFIDMGIMLDDTQKFQKVIANIHNYYNENQKKDLWVDIGEYSDIIAIDHLAGYMDYMMKMIQNNKNIRIKFYTKSANFDNVLKYEGDNRVMITMNLNTEYVINRYEKYTASLNSRIEAIKKILTAKGFLVNFIIAPILIYDGYESDYTQLCERIKGEFDLADKKVRTVMFGAVRYKPVLRTEILNNHPETDLFDDVQKLIDPVGIDQRLRYPEEVREEISKRIIGALNLPKEKLQLSCEFHGMWDRLGFDWKGYMDKFVFQYNDQNKNKYPL